ncbi:bacterial-type glycerol dehydrogenase [Leptomonas pyrrhocoris]|uniref:Bacterial-type glycerol dehydrogenase n=1 Tax=Leptomonas pyrrhocoris TaxID=157538 RepID=A0A0N0VF84_LEPPY|nr:bacterial-type glycerol dehydrogenase [Leptomonas pyrrhocoris]XP_015658464.1 bacterial-type glycerol dehydrogenase [Leptomonas pyrrhocoris]XP_015658465.1 bacterial-type glycerol dehydrogenase [Leptomonas pyrrhocoris]KPA80024.1 bacterial-type glycerol dehydrogenase [Leptomonas pyrrhocoris]KPA80025.1 bacterial-type glycerol dehydrogenase [Leptomonas pyrrhocoris]KPA80026.1 bacterial-type glycerol dehydrogenase [Leptomonas pyrrhocoris]|eukprot:XP_015658463.1 bacterial-type glycerol dehydrogenase [Leptomonas pyrrhocoris]
MLRTFTLRGAKHPAIRTAIFPGRYVQGPGAIDLLGDELSRFGKQALILADPFVAETMKDKILKSLNGKVDVKLEVFSRECCDHEIHRLADNKGVDVVAGIGGGKTMDTCKAVAHTLKVPIAVVPTIASSDAPCSALSVIYTRTGEFDRYLFLPKNPDLVLMDSDIICKAPVRFLVSGMGDALATYFEAESAFATHSGNMTGYMGAYTAMGLARMCYDTLLEYGVMAKRACEAKTTCPALERIIEANTLLSGLGFESGGLAACHAIHNGLSIIEECHHFWHGEKVAIGVLASMFLVDRPPEVVNRVYQFCEDVGLPTTLADIGIKSISPEQLMNVAELSCAENETMANERGVITPVAVANAIRVADAYGRARKPAK